MQGWRQEIHELANALRTEMREGLAALRAEMHALIYRSQVSPIKWMFAFWMGQIAVVLGILKMLGTI